MLPFVGESVFAYGVLYVENAPLQPEGTAIAFGDVVLAGIRGKLIGPVQAGVTSAAHELMHVLQGRIFGPLYFPLNAVGWAASLAHFALRGFSATDWMSPIHGSLNFMERGPLSLPPRVLR